jgi:CheY-like chemotaxis protein
MNKILLVEDDVYIRDVTATRLQEHNFEVFTAGSGEEALSVMDTVTPDLVLMDLDLPDVYGLELVAELKKSDKLAPVPVIIFTNNDAPEIIEKVFASGAKDFFNKAMTDFEQLLEVIQRNIPA